MKHFPHALLSISDDVSGPGNTSGVYPLLKSVEDYHASYLSIHWWPQQLLEDNRETVERIGRRLGYRLQLRELTLPKEANVGEWFGVQWAWANDIPFRASIDNTNTAIKKVL